MKNKVSLSLVIGLSSFLHYGQVAAETLTSETLKLRPNQSQLLELKHYKLRAAMGRTLLEESASKDSISNFTLTTEGKAEISRRLNFDVSVTGIIEQNSTQQSTRRDSGLYLNQAQLKTQLSPSFNIDIGSLSQRKNMSPLIANDSSYPAVRENFQFKSGSWDYIFSSQQAVPTSTKLSVMTNDEETLPSYISTAFSMTKSWPFGTRARFIPGLYQFSNLPAAVAYESCLMGNSVNSTCSPNSSFTHNFFGTDIYADVTLNLPEEWVITTSANYLQNFEAPSGKAHGFFFELDFFKGLNSDQSLGWTFQYFEKQPDVTPAFYAPFLYENNRKGYGGTMDYAFSRRQIHIKTTFLQSTPLNKTILQNSTVNFVHVSLEAGYESL